MNQPTQKAQQSRGCGGAFPPALLPSRVMSSIYYILTIVRVWRKYFVVAVILYICDTAITACALC